MPKQILLVEDSVTMQKVVEITFAHEDYRIASARDADEAMGRIREVRPDVIVLDAGLPGRSGYDLCAALKADAANRDIPVLLLTSNFNPYDEARGQKASIDAHVVKPFETQVLIDKVADLLRRRGGAQPPTLVAVPQMTGSPPSASSQTAPGRSISTMQSVPPTRPANPSQQLPVVAPAQPVRPVASGVAEGVQRSTLMGIPAVNPLGGPGMRPPPPPGMRVRETGNLPAINPPGVTAGQAAPAVSGAASTGTLPPPSVQSPPMPSWSGQRPPEARQTIMQGSTGLSLTGATPTPPQGAGAVTSAAVTAPAPAPIMPAPVGSPQATVPGIPAVGGPQMPRPSLIPRAPIPQTVLATLERIAQRGAEYEAIAKLSMETIEQIVWEVVPELAEVIIRAELDRLIKERESKG